METQSSNKIIKALEFYSDELRTIVDIVHSKLSSTDSENRIISLQLEQIYDVFSSIMILIKEGKISSSNALLRVLFESYVQFIFIIQDKETMPAKLIIYRYFLYNNLGRDIGKKISVVNRDKPINRETRLELKKAKGTMSEALKCFLSSVNNEDFKQRVENKDLRNNWYSLYMGTPMSIRDLSEQVYCHNSDVKNWSIFYDDLYPQLSMYVHGYKGYESIGQEASREELNESVVNLVGTACSFILNDLLGWLNKTGYLDDKNIRQDIKLANLDLANKLIAELHVNH